MGFKKAKFTFEEKKCKFFAQKPAKYVTCNQWIAGAMPGSFRQFLQLFTRTSVLAFGY